MQFLGERLAGLVTPAGNDNRRALSGEGEGGGAPDAGQTSSDQYDRRVSSIQLLDGCTF